MAIEAGLSTHEAEAEKLNGSQFSANADKLAVENERLRRANSGGTAPTVPAQEPPPNEGDEDDTQEE